jgi:hypothetical protein
MNRRRFQDPDRLPGAANFSDDETLRGSLNAVRLVKSQKWMWDGLRQACDLEVHYARHREPGFWELAAVAFVTSGHVDVQPWRDQATDELWQACGFAARPSYSTTIRRLAELETVCDEFLSAAALVIQRCRMHDARVMAHTHVDWTEDNSHSRLVHDCQPGDDCKRPKHRAPARVSAEVARQGRHELSAMDPAQAEAIEKKQGPDKTEPEPVMRKGRLRKRVRMNDCWYTTRDFDAGIRSYTGPNGVSKKFWHGYASGKIIDHFTGGVIPSVDNASVNESHIFPKLFDKATEMIGQAPETIVADRGISIKNCFQHATERGTAPIFPWRMKGSDRQERDQLEYDRHGVKRCRACGGPMQQVKFSCTDGKPRLWFRCMIGLTEDCKRDQTISCNKDWTLLVPLPKTDALYHELMVSHQTYEGTHSYFRDRYRVAANTLTNTPKRVGIGWHQLRANVACLVDWLKIAARCGWLGSARSKERHQGTRVFKGLAKRDLARLEDGRAFLGLAAPYGPAAIKAGFLQEKPPSDRPPPVLA